MNKLWEILLIAHLIKSRKDECAFVKQGQNSAGLMILSYHGSSSFGGSSTIGMPYDGFEMNVEMLHLKSFQQI